MAIAVVLLLALWRFSSLPALKLIVGRLATTATAANRQLGLGGETMRDATTLTMRTEIMVVSAAYEHAL